MTTPGLSGGYAMLSLDLATVEADPDWRWPRVPEAAEGLAFVVRDGAAIVGFSMYGRADLAGRAARGAGPIDDEMRAAAICARLRDRLAPEMAPEFAPGPAPDPALDSALDSAPNPAAGWAPDLAAGPAAGWAPNSAASLAGPLRPMTVAICTKDRPDWVARLLASLVPLAVGGVEGGEGVEILVVDNAPSDDATAQVVAQVAAQVAGQVPGQAAGQAAAGRVRHVVEPLTGLDFARNRAVREATGEILAFLDDDVVVDPGWVRGMRRAWADNPDAGAVTGLVMPMALETPAQVLFERRGGFRRGFLPLRYGATTFRDPLHPCGAGKFGAGANMSFDLALVRRLGGFDEALDTGRPLPGGGDLDMFYRVLRAGRPLVYEPRAAVFHDHRRDLETLRRQYRSWGTGFGAFLAKSMRADPAMRPALRGMVWWWLRYQAHRVKARLFGRDPTPMPMIASEIAGGLQGLCGEYGRSERRSARIRGDLA